MPFPFSFPLLFLFFLSSFFLSHLSFSVFPVLDLFSFVLSYGLVVFRLFLGSPSSIFFSLHCFPWWRILLFCYFVSALHPPRAPCEPEVCVFPLRAVFFMAFLMLIFFSYRRSLFLFRFRHRLFHPVFFMWVLCYLLGFGFCCDSLSI